MILNSFKSHKEIIPQSVAANLDLKNSKFSQFKPQSSSPALTTTQTSIAPPLTDSISLTTTSSLLDTTNTMSQCPLANQFIDPCELVKNLFKNLVLLDCRTFTDFNSKHIKDSVHLNCRDKLIKKRLQTKKISVKDLISCQEIKNKFDVNELNLAACGYANKQNDMIIIYDDKTSDLDELRSDSNPLKIVQENIKQCGFKNECKILKGGFMHFFEKFPDYCVNKTNSSLLNTFELQLDQQQSAIDNAVMTRITPFLYLGNELDAKNIDKLRENGILYILNVTKNIPFYTENNINNYSSLTSLENNKFVPKRISVNDSTNQNLLQHFEESIQFIEEAKSNNSKVLVHCQAGISRSPTIVIAYLMKTYGLKMNEAYQKVRSDRPIIAPNLIFMSQLMDYENQIFNINDENSCKFNTNTNTNNTNSCLKIMNSNYSKPCSSILNESNDQNDLENSSKQIIQCS